LGIESGDPSCLHLVHDGPEEATYFGVGSAVGKLFAFQRLMKSLCSNFLADCIERCEQEKTAEE
jgi:hypothetical protein